VCSVRARISDEPSRPALEERFTARALASQVTRHEAPAALLRRIHMVFRNGMLVQPGEHNDYILDKAAGTVRWSVPLEEWEQICVFCPADGSRWAWSPQCGVFVDIRR
jgi:hypothetical protein